MDKILNKQFRKIEKCLLTYTAKQIGLKEFVIKKSKRDPGFCRLCFDSNYNKDVTTAKSIMSELSTRFDSIFKEQIDYNLKLSTPKHKSYCRHAAIDRTYVTLQISPKENVKVLEGLIRLNGLR